MSTDNSKIINKMNKQDAILKIKESLKNLMKFSEVTESKFAEIIAKDGKKYVTPADKLDVDVEIYGLDEEGNQIPVENGPIELEDGSTIIVTDNKVTEIKTVEPKDGEESPIEDAEMEVEPTDIEKEVEVETEPVSDDDYGKRIEKIEMQMEEILTILSSMVSNGEETMEKVETALSKIEKISDEPAGVKVKVSPFSTRPEDVRLEKFLQIKNNLK